MRYSIAEKRTLNEEFRIDAEYYSLENLTKEDAVTRNNYRRLGGICELVAGPFGSTVTTEKYDATSDKRYIRGKDIQSFFIEKNDAVFLDNDLFNELPQFHLRAEDILLTVVGMKFGKSAIVSAEDCPAVFSCKSTLVRNPSVNVWYLLTYLSSSIGYGLVRRGQRGAAQPGINLFDIRNVPVPILGGNFQSRIEISVKHAKSLVRASNTAFVDAQTLLLSELGLINWQPRHERTFVKNCSDAEQAERIDAEYFQPKYEEIDRVLMKFNGKPIGSCEFLDITTGQYCDNYVARNEGQPYLRGTDLAAGSVDIDNLVYIKREEQMQSKQAQEGDVVVTRVGTIGLSARIPNECVGGTISDNLVRVRILDKKKIDSYYLTCFLGSEVGKSLMLRNARGSVQQRLNQETLKEIILPIPEMEIQSKIKHKIAESFNLRKQSKHLLECAKRSVEMAIESDEQTAIGWLENETKEVQG